MLGGSGVAQAADTEIGKNFSSGIGCNGAQYEAPTAAVAPSDGWITQFSYQSGVSGLEGSAGDRLAFKVFRAVEGGLLVVGTTDVVTLATSTDLETFAPAAPIAVQAGDIVGFWNETELENCVKFTGSGGIVGGAGPNPGVGTTVPAIPAFPGLEPNVSALFFDATAPETTISDGPGAVTDDTTPTFRFSSSTEPSTFECQIDDGDFAPCEPSGGSYTTEQLEPGAHVFRVRATDPALLTDPTPAEYPFTIEEPVAPDTIITAGPTGSTPDQTPTFEFEATQPVSGFECQVDDGDFVACSSPYTIAQVADGEHVFRVRAIGDDTPAEQAFTVERFCFGQAATIYRGSGYPGTSTATPNAPMTIVGTSGNDVIYAANGDDVIDGGGGDDLICGVGGNDKIRGGAGNDRIFGSAGDDDLGGQAGDDEVIGGADNDRVNGGAGNDTVRGGDGNDILNGGDGDDRLFGGNDDDVLSGGEGIDDCQGNGGTNTVTANGGCETVTLLRASNDTPARTTSGDRAVVTAAEAEGASWSDGASVNPKTEANPAAAFLPNTPGGNSADVEGGNVTAQGDS
jgi:hypothetical protein